MVENGGLDFELKLIICTISLLYFIFPVILLVIFLLKEFEIRDLCKTISLCKIFNKCLQCFVCQDCRSKTSSTTDFAKATVNSCGSDSRLENV
ncbi:unnamed protein product [Oikopleura dioica]|uniref:Uncharacterized protein n=1 Tax=Oikopleura dioica TaxID=34765 RepID=E4XT26_OIKDI|nr:unnamed protein product [Oikopleura dioica]CBY37381.1 unnamed protein product [Oikopleura dioica]